MEKLISVQMAMTREDLWKNALLRTMGKLIDDWKRKAMARDCFQQVQPHTRGKAFFDHHVRMYRRQNYHLIRIWSCHHLEHGSLDSLKFSYNGQHNLDRVFADAATSCSARHWTTDVQRASQSYFGELQNCDSQATMVGSHYRKIY